MLDGFSFDPFSLLAVGLRPTEADVCGCDVVQALVIALVVVMLDERFDHNFQNFELSNTSNLLESGLAYRDWNLGRGFGLPKNSKGSD